MDLQTGKEAGVHMSETVRCSRIHAHVCCSITSQCKWHDCCAGGIRARKPIRGIAVEAEQTHKQRGENMIKKLHRRQ